MFTEIWASYSGVIEFDVIVSVVFDEQLFIIKLDDDPNGVFRITGATSASTLSPIEARHPRPSTTPHPPSFMLKLDQKNGAATPRRQTPRVGRRASTRPWLAMAAEGVA
ncbi:hypothetical protein [Hydrogenophaga sp.]|uniref:hypothetical protein n=1 Tax=Hydrogenophaga sp. TaxID=1904254 RepID=UPI002626ED5D|nr:hypothetical protein [Hydrogenophaga sp.]